MSPTTTTLNGVGVSRHRRDEHALYVATEINGPGSPAGVINMGATAGRHLQVKISTNPPPQINNVATVYVNGTEPRRPVKMAAQISRR